MSVTNFFSACELQDIGFKKVGSNVLLSRKSSIYGAANISIGNNVRIDDFTILSGKILIEDHIHIAAGTYLFGGKAGIHLENFVNISSRCALYAQSDDFTGKTLTSPQVPERYKNVFHQAIHLQKHVLIGSNSTILPGVTLSEGSAIGAHSVVKESTLAWSIYAGSPVKKLRARSKDLLKLEQDFLINEGYIHPM